MPRSRGKRRSPKQPDDIRFFLDESLPERVADALRLVRYPITGPMREGIRGIKDDVLIPWMAENGYVWITKDDDARRTHLDALIKSQISSVWVRGIDRQKNRVTPQEVHLMLTVKLMEIIRRVSESVGPRHLLLYLTGERPTLSELDVHTLRRKRERRLRRS